MCKESVGISEQDRVSVLNETFAALQNMKNSIATFRESTVRIDVILEQYRNMEHHGIRPALATVGNSITLWFLCDDDIAVLYIWKLLFSGHLRTFIENLFLNVFGEEHISILLRINFKEFKHAQMTAGK